MFRQPEADVGSTLLEAVGYTIISIAVFDVAEYLFEEETVRSSEMRHAGEARRSMTKFISTIAIAVFLKALVSVFEASKEDVRLMLYPTLKFRQREDRVGEAHCLSREGILNSARR